MDSLGRTTCLTGTDTAGDTNFNAAAAKASIADVDGTVASVNTAIAAIANGTVGGLVPGVALINNVAAANTAVDAFAKALAASNPEFDAGAKDGLVSSDEVTAAALLATGARTKAITDVKASLKGTESTVLLSAELSDAVTAVATKKAALNAAATTDAQKLLVTNYDTAVTARAALETTAAQKAAFAVSLATNKEGVAQAIAASGATVTLDSLSKAAGITVNYASVGDVYEALALSTGLNAEQRIALVTELTKIPTFGSALVSQSNQAYAVSKADATVGAAKTLVEAIGATAGTDYTAAVTAKDLATKVVEAAKAADVKIDAIKAVQDQYTALDKSVADATKALTDFGLANASKVAITPLTASVDATAKQDVFYFAHKALAANDFSIGGASVAFAAGDSLVLGSGYTFNNGALSTGDSNVLEFFLVKGATGTQIVVETEAHGNANTVVGADGTITAAGSPSAAVINLVGVTADHLSVANGVVSYV